MMEERKTSEPLFTVHTKHSYEQYKEYCHKAGHLNRKLFLWTGIYAIVVIVIMLVPYLLWGVLFWWLLLFIPALFIALLVKNRIKVKRGWKETPFVHEDGYEEQMSFYEDHLEHTSRNGERRIPYDMISDIITGEKGVYLMLTRQSGMVLDKEQVSPALAQFLDEKRKGWQV